MYVSQRPVPIYSLYLTETTVYQTSGLGHNNYRKPLYGTTVMSNDSDYFHIAPVSRNAIHRQRNDDFSGPN